METNYHIVTAVIMAGLIAALYGVTFWAVHTIDDYKYQLAQCQSHLLVEPGK